MTAFGELTPAWRRSVRTAVRGWYRQHGRSLPWRDSSDAYRIWISEIMLQQTTVAAVIPYFDRFVTRFPTVRELANAPITEVLRLWEGLGYYSRARNLHKAAEQIVKENAGELPASAVELQKLPGIGRYTAGAIASFAFDQPAPIVEANTVRLFARLMAMQRNAKSSAGQKQLWDFATWLIDPKHPAMFNQAVMDLGAKVCRAVDPQCSQCPLQHHCQALRQSRVSEIPSMPRKADMTDVTELAVAIERNGRWLMRQCRDNERWAGLWDFVRFPIPADESRLLSTSTSRAHSPRGVRERRGGTSHTPLRLASAALPIQVGQRIEQLTGLAVTASRPLTEIRHVVTRYRILLLVHSATAPPGRVATGTGYRWKSNAQIGKLPMPVTGRQIARQLLDES